MSVDPAASAPGPAPRARRERRWLPVLAVLTVIAVVDGGGMLVGGRGEQAAARTQVVGGAVRIRPLSGWTAAEPPGAVLPELALTRGSVTLDVIAVPGSGDTLDDLASRYVQEILAPRLDDLTIGQPDTGSLTSGIPTLRFGYMGVDDGVPIEGVATIAVVSTTGAVFDAFAPKGDLAWAASDLESMISGAEVG
jgi:hypothetical protein